MGEETISRSVEIPEEDMAALRSLAPVLWDEPGIRSGGRLSDARLLRIAIYEGLASLKRRYAPVDDFEDEFDRAHRIAMGEAA